MSNFTCQHCGTDIIDSPGGPYITECEHYPIEKVNSEMPEIAFGCMHGRPPGRACPHCMGINGEMLPVKTMAMCMDEVADERYKALHALDIGEWANEDSECHNDTISDSGIDITWACIHSLCGDEFWTFVSEILKRKKQ